MSIVGFTFTKINAERKNAMVGQVSITNNISLKDVKEARIGMADRGALACTFTFVSEYQPNFATMTFDGEIIALVNSKDVPKIMDDWKTKRFIPQVLAAQIMNHALDRCNIQALLLAKDLNLPSPVPLPKVQINTPAPAAPAQKEAVKTTKVDAKKKK